MKATEADIQQLIQGDKQFMVPLFQRTYKWTKKEWQELWDDIEDVYDAGETLGHFIGSIVTVEMAVQPHEMSLSDNLCKKSFVIFFQNHRRSRTWLLGKRC